MFDRLLTLQLVSSKNCFCYLSPNNIKELQGKAVKLSYGDKKQAYLSVDPSVKVTDDQVIAISSLYGRTLGLKDNESVTVSEISAVPNIQSLTIYPLTMDDYDVVEMLAETIQSTLLTQVRILNNDQKVVIWIGKLYVTVNVSDIKPMSPGRIDNLVEVTIKKPNEIRKNRDSDLINTLEKPLNNSQVPRPVKANSIFESYLKDKSPAVFRLASISLLKHNFLDEFEHPFNIFLFENQLSLEFRESFRSGQIFCMKPLCTLDNNTDKVIHVQLHILENSNRLQNDKSAIFTNLFVNNEVLKFLNCPVGARVKLEPDNTFPDIQQIEISSKNHKTINVIETFKKYLGRHCKTHPAVLNSDFIFNIANGVRCYVKFQPETHRFCLVTGDFIRNCKFSVNYEATFPVDSVPSKIESKCITNVSNFEDIVHSSSVVADTTINGRMNSFLITGGVGRGKTTLLNIIENKFSTDLAQIHTKRIHCKTLKGKTLESFQKFLIATLTELVHFQPSMLLLDDVNVLCEDESASEGAPHSMVYFNRISEMLEGLLNTYSKHNLIGIIMTCESAYKLNKNIYGSRGNHFFKLVYSLDNLNKTDRRKILEHLFSGHQLQSVSLDSLADKMESFVFQDIKDFANKALYESYEEDYNQESLVLNEEICQRALEATTVTTLHDINLSSSGLKDFSDVGGLDEIKSVLIETLFWPSKYSNLFSNSPLRLPSGLLLYGPPGTGKTLIAAAAATQCSLRLISVKGPELLSKYIGASEQAVRDVFQKAQGAKPCILFFDEFDSLAPRRGHDNTGVTDRVVNQLLTQLDGVESLAGVFVLAATSRPDLLDPALLRPGRLDRHVFCPLPNRDSRLSILRALSNSMKFSPDIDLDRIADRTEGFSGADIQSLLYSAQLSTVDDLLSDEVTSEEVDSEINQDQLEEALKKTKPSVTRQERKKFDRIYKKFRSGGIEDFAAGSRATLA